MKSNEFIGFGFKIFLILLLDFLDFFFYRFEFFNGIRLEALDALLLRSLVLFLHLIINFSGLAVSFLGD